MSEFKVSLVYRKVSRTARAKPLSFNKPTNQQTNKKQKQKNPVRPKRGFCITLPIHAEERTERARGG